MLSRNDEVVRFRRDVGAAAPAFAKAMYARHATRREDPAGLRGIEAWERGIELKSSAERQVDAARLVVAQWKVQPPRDADAERLKTELVALADRVRGRKQWLEAALLFFGPGNLARAVEAVGMKSEIAVTSEGLLHCKRPGVGGGGVVVGLGVNRVARPEPRGVPKQNS